MKKYSSIIFLVICIHFSSIGQQLVNFNFQAPSLDSQWITNQVYIPVGYDQNSDHQYPILIYLHARDGSGWAPSATAALMQIAAKDLFAEGQVDPIIMIFPWVELNAPDTEVKGHLWADSEYFGPISNVITQDLFAWLYSEDKMNLKNKVANHKDQIAIGGFDMGADGALRILFNHPDQFMGVLANFPNIPIIESPIIANVLIPNAVQETGQNGPPYNFSLGSGFTIHYIYSLSAAWAPLKNRNIQFLLNTDSSIKGDVLQFMADTADCLTIINKNKLYTEGNHSPCIFLESNDGPFTEFSDVFMSRLAKIASPDRIHHKMDSDYTFDSVKVGLEWIIEKMSVTTSVQSQSEDETSYQVYPNPATDMVNIQWESSDNHKVKCEMLDLTGKSISTQHQKVNRGSNHLILDFRENLTEGIYLLNITGEKGSLHTQKIIINQ